MSKTVISGSIGCVLLVLAINLIGGGMSVNYLLTVFLQHPIPFIAAVAIGLFVGEFTIPVAIVVWILKSCGVF